MCAVSSLPVFYIEVLGSSVVQLCDPSTEKPVAAIREGWYAGVRGDKSGWILVQHPERGLLGLPLKGSPSWWTAWDNSLIEISLAPPSKKSEPIQDWCELSHLSLL